MVPDDGDRPNPIVRAQQVPESSPGGAPIGRAPPGTDKIAVRSRGNAASGTGAESLHTFRSN